MNMNIHLICEYLTRFVLFYPLSLIPTSFLLILFWSKVNGLFHRLLNLCPVHIPLFDFLRDRVSFDSNNFNFNMDSIRISIPMVFVMGIGH